MLLPPANPRSVQRRSDPALQSGAPLAATAQTARPFTMLDPGRRANPSTAPRATSVAAFTLLRFTSPTRSFSVSIDFRAPLRFSDISSAESFTQPLMASIRPGRVVAGGLAGTTAGAPSDAGLFP